MGVPHLKCKIYRFIYLMKEIVIEDEYRGYLDWDYPPNPSPWTQKQKQDFKKRANLAYRKLTTELGSDYEVINELDRCVE
jgi:hypothetical protein